MHTVSRWFTRALLAAAGSVLVLGAPASAAPQISSAGNVQVQGGIQEAFPAPPGAPQLDRFSALTTAASVQFTGTVERATSVEVQGPLGTQVVPVAGNGFTATVSLAPNLINDVYLTGISDTAVRGTPTLARVTRDLTAPEVFIDNPVDGATTTQATVDVSGRVGDLLSGFEGLMVSVNGVRAEVNMGLGTNGTYFASGVPVNAGSTTQIQVSATDVLGNNTLESITITHVTPPPGSATIEFVSGDAQTAQGQTELPLPIVARVLRGDGSPFSGKLVTFQVKKNDGQLAASSGGTYRRTLQVFADAAGEVRAWWKVGSSAGCGNNRVVASAVDVFGSVEFDASATAMPAARVLVGTGNNQTAEVGTPALMPLEAWVTDGCNGIAGVPVTFSVVEGGGSLGGSTTALAMTDLTGRARVTLDLGLLPGLNRVEATYPGNVEPPASFLVTGVRRDPNEATRFTGLVLNDAGLPLGGANVTLDVGSTTLATVATSDAGTFEILAPNLGGPAHLDIDGATASMLDGVPIQRGTYPHLAYRIVVVPNVENRLPEPIRLPELQMQNHVTFTNQNDAVLTVAGIDGMALRVKAGSMTLANGMVPDAANPVQISVNPVQFDDIPMPLPNGAAFPIAWTLQPSGATFDPPVAVELPNAAGLPAGSVAYLFSFDHDIEQFAIVATGSVTEDGSTVVTDAGDGITKAGWAGVCPPYPPRTSVAGQLFPGWQDATSWFGNVVGLLDVLDNPCNRFQDGTPEGELLRRNCAQNGTLCLASAFGLANGLSGTMNNGTPPTELEAVMEQELQRFLEYRAGLNGTSVPTVAATILSGAELRVTEGVPALTTDATLNVDFSFPPDLATGDFFDAVGVAPYALGPGLVGFEVLNFPTPVQATIRVRLIALDFRPRGTVFVGGQSRPLPAPGSFILPNVPATPEIPLRPILVFEGLDEQYVLGPSTFQLPTVSGTTDFGQIDLDEVAMRRTGLDVSPQVTTFSTLGANGSLDVDVSLEDGTTRTAESNAAGSGYSVSGAGVVSVDGLGQLTAQQPGTAFVTVTHEGLAKTVTVLVSPGDPLTTVAGIVTLADGITPVANAAVTVFPGGLSTTSAADGSFSIPGVPTELGPLTLRVRADVAPRPGPEAMPAVASIAGITPAPDAFTDVGVVVLETPVFWAVDANGNWEDGANWSTGNPPAAGDAVLIDRAAGTFTITVNSTVSPSALFCEENLNVAGTLEVGDPFPFAGSMNLQSGTLRDVVILPTVGGSMTSQSGGNAFENVTLGVDLTINNLTDVTVTGGLTLDGATVSLQAASGGVSPRADLIFSGAQTLDGTGEIELTSGGSFNRVLVAGGPLTIEAGVPIRGLTGRIGSAGETIVLRSAITAESGQAILVPGDLVAESAAIGATGAGRVDLQGSVDLAGGTLSIDGEVRFLETIVGGSIAGPATAFLRAASDPTLDGVALGVRLVVPANELVTVRNGLTLANADVELAGPPAGVAFTGLLFDGAQTLSGTGEVVFTTGSGLNRFQLQNGPLVVEAGVPIRGVNARFDSVGETIVLRSSITMEGTSTMVVQSDLVTEGATVAATSTGRVQVEGDVDNAGDTLTLGGEVRFFGEILGGTVQGDASAFLRAGSASSLDGVELGVRLLVPANGSVTARNGLTLANADVEIAGPPAGGVFTRLVFDGAQSLSGTGEVVFTTGSGLNRFRVQNGPLVVEAGVPIRGLLARFDSVGETIVLRSSITMEGTSSMVVQSDLVTEGASLAATSTGRLQLDGDVDNAGNTLTIGGEVRFSSEILGGVVQGPPTSFLRCGSSSVLDGVDLGAKLVVPDGGGVTVRNGLNLSGVTVSITNDNAGGPSRLEFDGSQTLTGTGEIFFESFSNANRVTATPGSVVVLGPGIDVHGNSGRLGETGATMTVQGTVQTDPGTFVNLAGDFVNDGTLVVGGTGGTFATTAQGTFTQTTRGRLEVDLAGTTAGAGYGRLASTGAGNVAGHLGVTVVAPFVPTIGDLFGALTFSSATGGFTSANSVGMPAGTALQLNPLATQIQLEVVGN